MKTDLILKFKQNLFSKVIWSSTFKVHCVVLSWVAANSDRYTGTVMQQCWLLLKWSMYRPSCYVIMPHSILIDNFYTPKDGQTLTAVSWMRRFGVCWLEVGLYQNSQGSLCTQPIGDIAHNQSVIWHGQFNWIVFH